MYFADSWKAISVAEFREIVQQEQKIREKSILEKYVELGWQEYCADLRVSDEDKRYYYRQFLLGRGELCTNATPSPETPSEDARQAYNADIEEARQVAFLFLAAPLDGDDIVKRKCEIRNFRELYPGASQCSGNVGQVVMVYNKNELFNKVTTYIEEHRKKGRIVILFVGHGGPDGQITLAVEKCPLKEYIDCVDEVANNLYPPVPIDLINAQCYAHLVTKSRCPSTKIIHLSNEDSPQTNSRSYKLDDQTLSWLIVELQDYARTVRDKQDADAGKQSIPQTPTEETTQPAKGGFDLALFRDPVHERFKCKTCKLVLRDAMQAPCGHRHCKTCLDDFIRSSGAQRCSACPKGAEGGESQVCSVVTERFNYYKSGILCRVVNG
ncbi:uncharacterized protein LOC106180535 [Lingula anatina]|uniref:Uncharacterized protein LOC106180535 n=1 Tax=Lingula anatina TaxID=7574 RepID=A0A1S3KBX6_LINAN|nr:uncharacterized protein LOC106180535 [Lingula anatina]|eukprot:XP_013419997.1 uncharacterized protein LOC106180535 [Lingula anatina]